MIKKFSRIEEDTNKKEVIKQCNTSWKRFKTRLRNKYMDKGKEPFAKYNFIEEKTWADFVARENTEEKKKMREIAKANAMKKKDPPHLGPKGYRAMQLVWEEEEDDDKKVTSVHKIRDWRARDYLLSRMLVGPDGVRIIPPGLDSVAKRVLELDQKQTAGTWKAEPGFDLLSTVVGPEHHGRTRAVGYTTGWKTGIL